jgi:nucleoside-diphosphate-sugar epimerase
MSKILITGATGFVGNALYKNLRLKKYTIHVSVRSNQQKITEGVTSFNVGEICSETNWKDALKGVDCIIHCAARAHVMREKKTNILKNYRKINVEGTRSLAKQAVAFGVKRFIFLSSVKVNGEKTRESFRFKHNDLSRPEDAYAISKWEAEQVLLDESKKSGLEVVIIRAPLVYGYKAKGNLKRLIKLVRSGIPLPFSLVSNKRSLIGLDNLINVIIRCIDHPEAAGKTFLVSDSEDLSTPDLLTHISSAMGYSSRLFPVPISLLKFVSRVIGRKSEMDRLLESLQIDNSYTCEVLNWAPTVSVAEGIRRMVRGK